MFGKKTKLRTFHAHLTHAGSRQVLAPAHPLDRASRAIAADTALGLGRTVMNEADTVPDLT